MPTTTTQLSKDYSLEVEVNKVEALPDHVHIAVRSRWAGAKNPEAPQLRWSVILNEEQALEIVDVILSATETEEI